MHRRTPALALAALVLALPASAQTRGAASAEAARAPGAPAASSVGSVPALSAAPLTTPGLSVAPLSAPGLSAAASLAPSAPSAAAAMNASPAPAVAASVAPAAAAAPAAPALPISAVPAAGRNQQTRTPVAGRSAVSAKAEAIVEGGIAEWGDKRAAADGPGVDRPSAGPALTPSRAKPRLAKGAFAAGAALVGVAAAAVTAPHSLPAALVAAKGLLAYSGFGLLAASRFWKAPAETASGVENQRNQRPDAGPEKKGQFATFRAIWKNADGAARSQAGFEAKVGGSSWAAFLAWLLGGLRSGLSWLPVSLVAMLGGALVGKLGGIALGFKEAAAAAPMSLLKMSAFGMVLGPLAANLLQTAMGLALFDAARAGLARLGLKRGSGVAAALVTLAASAAMLVTLTHSPFVIAATLAAEASTLALRARSKSWLAPMALSGMFSVLSLNSARMGVFMKFGAVGTLTTLPAVWTGLAVAGMLLAGLVWQARSVYPTTIWRTLKEQIQAVGDFGAWWKAPTADGAPKSPWRLLKLAGLWGLITYAVGDLTYWGVNAIAAGSEPAPAALARMLSSPVDLVLYNFLFVGFFEEFVFRRGLFRSIRDRLAKWGMTAGRAFWTAAIAAALIFSGAHYIDYGAVLGHLGLGSALASSGLGGSYAFSWPGFVSRSVLGVLLAWVYQRSGTLVLPALAHAAADTLEGLGLRWGLAAFLAMNAIVLAAQRLGAKAKQAALPMTKAYKAFRDALIYGGFAAAFAPFLCHAAPAIKSVFLFSSMAFLALPVLGLVNLIRWLRRNKPVRNYGLRARAALAALGLAIGLGLGFTPQLATGPIAQAMYGFSDVVNHKHSDVRAIPGNAMQDETVRVLSANPVGREILRKLQDRGGVVRMPRFFLRSSGDVPGLEIVADHEGFTDGLYIGMGALHAHGWSVDEFLRRPDWQRQAVVENQETLAHELLHAVQSRRSPFSRETWALQSMEHEYEAYGVELLYVHERLKADPRAAVDPDDYYAYTDALDRGPMASLKAHDADYPQDHHVDGPRWRAFRADLEARWPEVRVEGYMLLSQRYGAYPRVAAGYVQKAKDVAAAAGLPDPTAPQYAGTGRSIAP